MPWITTLHAFYASNVYSNINRKKINSPFIYQLRAFIDSTCIFESKHVSIDIKYLNWYAMLCHSFLYVYGACIFLPSKQCLFPTFKACAFSYLQSACPFPHAQKHKIKKYLQVLLNFPFRTPFYLKFQWMFVICTISSHRCWISKM